MTGNIGPCQSSSHQHLFATDGRWYRHCVVGLQLYHNRFKQSGIIRHRRHLAQRHYSALRSSRFRMQKRSHFECFRLGERARSRTSPGVPKWHLLRSSPDVHVQRRWRREQGELFKKLLPRSFLSNKSVTHPPCSSRALRSPTPFGAVTRVIPAPPDTRALTGADAKLMASRPMPT